MAIRILERIRVRPVLRGKTTRMTYATFNIIGIIIGAWLTAIIIWGMRNK